jgi:hypothetical protein
VSADSYFNLAEAPQGGRGDELCVPDPETGDSPCDIDYSGRCRTCGLQVDEPSSVRQLAE